MEPVGSRGGKSHSQRLNAELVEGAFMAQCLLWNAGDVVREYKAMFAEDLGACIF